MTGKKTGKSKYTVTIRQIQKQGPCTKGFKEFLVAFRSNGVFEQPGVSYVMDSNYQIAGLYNITTKSKFGPDTPIPLTTILRNKARGKYWVGWIVDNVPTDALSGLADKVARLEEEADEKVSEQAEKLNAKAEKLNREADKLRDKAAKLDTAADALRDKASDLSSDFDREAALAQLILGKTTKKAKAAHGR